MDDARGQRERRSRASGNPETRTILRHHTRHIIFRFVHPDPTPIRIHSRPSWNLWQRWLLPIMAQAAATERFVPGTLTTLCSFRQHHPGFDGDLVDRKSRRCMK